MSAKVLLTTKYIESPARVPKSGRVEIKDSEIRGLALRVSENGYRSFILTARFGTNRNPTRRSIGPYPEVTLQEARDTALAWRRQIRQGIDPAVLIARERAEKQRQDAATFGQVAEEYIARHVSTLSRSDAVAKQIRTEFCKRWAKRPISEITAQDCDAAIRAIVKRGAPGQAHIAFATLKAMLNWTVGNPAFGLDRSPMEHLKSGIVVGKKNIRQRYLNDDELRAVWQAADADGYPFGSIVKMLILTGQRLREIADMKWSECQDDMIVLDAKRMKMDVAHTIPLAPDALALMQSLPRFVGPYVFSARGGRSPFTGFARAKQRLDQVSGVTDWVLHDCRRSFRSRLSALPIEEVVREAMIAHGPTGIKKVYNVHNYDNAKRRGFQLYEAALRRVLNPPPAADVIPLKPRRRLLATA